MDKAGVEIGQRLERLESDGTQYTPIRILRLVFFVLSAHLEVMMLSNVGKVVKQASPERLPRGSAHVQSEALFIPWLRLTPSLHSALLQLCVHCVLFTIASLVVPVPLLPLTMRIRNCAARHTFAALLSL